MRKGSDARLVPRRGPARRALAAAIGLGVLAGGTVIVQAWLLSHAISLTFLGGGTLEQITPWLLAWAATAAARAVLSWGSDICAARGAAEMRVDLRTRLSQRLLDGGPSRASEERTGELANTLVGGIEATDGYIRSYLPQVVLSVATPLLIAAVITAVDPLSALVLVLTYPLIPLFMYLIGGVARERTRRQWVTLSRMSARFLDAIQGLATLKAFGRSVDEAMVIATAMGRYRAVTMGVLKVAFISALVLELLSTLGTAIVAVEVGLRLLYARVAFDAALFVLVLAPEFYRPLRSLGAAFHAGMAGKEAGARIAALLDETSELPTAPRGRSADGPAGVATAPPPATVPWRHPGDTPPAIVFDDVCFSYGSGRRLALDGFTLRVDAGSLVALVGPSGAGKSTLFQLLLRFARPQHGRILVDGRALDDLDIDEWRRVIAWVPQRPHVFDGTLRDNLLVARPDASRAQIEDALRLAHADGLVARLPRGLDTAVGARGDRLSGGEAQRLALARAFLKDTPVVLLDEPTAQLDPATEALVRDAMSRLRVGRTVLLIAHRLTTVVDADRIVLMDAGHILEEGSHERLLAGRGAYARLVEAYGGTR